MTQTYPSKESTVYCEWCGDWWTVLGVISPEIEAFCCAECRQEYKNHYKESKVNVPDADGESLGL